MKSVIFVYHMNLKSCILAMFALSFLTSCTYSKQVSEKMEILEGVYTLLNPVSISIPGKSYLPASVVETDGHWVFSFMIPVQFNGKTVLHQFEEEIIWSPEINDYLFSSFSEADLTLLNAEKAITSYSNGEISMVLVKGLGNQRWEKWYPGRSRYPKYRWRMMQ